MARDLVADILAETLRTPGQAEERLSGRLINKTLGDPSGINGKIVVNADYSAGDTQVPVTITAIKPAKAGYPPVDFDEVARTLANGMAERLGKSYTFYDRDLKKTMTEEKGGKGITITLRPTDIEKGAKPALEKAVTQAYRETVDSNPALAALEGAAIVAGNGRS